MSFLFKELRKGWSCRRFNSIDGMWHSWHWRQAELTGLQWAGEELGRAQGPRCLSSPHQLVGLAQGEINMLCAPCQSAALTLNVIWELRLKLSPIHPSCFLS